MNWIHELHQLFGRIPVPPRITWGRRVPSLILLKKEWVLHVLRLVLGGDGFRLRLQLESLIEVASAHSCPILFNVRYHCPWYLLIPLWIDGRSDLPVLTYPFRFISAWSSQFWVANHDIFGLEENDREFLRSVLSRRQLYCGRSSTLWRLYGTVSVLQFYRAEHHGVTPSWLRSAGKKEHPVLICEIFGWIRFQPRGVRRRYGSLLDSNSEDIENVVLSELFRRTQKTLHCPFHESSLSNCY